MHQYFVTIVHFLFNSVKQLQEEHLSFVFPFFLSLHCLGS